MIKIDTGVGDTTTPNGLATPALVDIDGDMKADYIYAGALQGNLWKVDATSTRRRKFKFDQLYISRQSIGLDLRLIAFSY